MSRAWAELLVLAALTALLCWAAALFAAPVPPPRAKVRPGLAGRWAAEWGRGGEPWPTVLSPCGAYAAERAGGPRWEGRWSLEGDVLTIEERPVMAEGGCGLARHTFTLRPGRLESACGRLRLMRPGEK